jgi:hypothetical protein
VYNRIELTMEGLRGRSMRTPIPMKAWRAGEPVCLGGDRSIKVVVFATDGGEEGQWFC